MFILYLMITSAPHASNNHRGKSTAIQLPYIQRCNIITPLEVKWITGHSMH